MKKIFKKDLEKKRLNLLEEISWAKEELGSLECQYEEIELALEGCDDDEFVLIQTPFRHGQQKALKEMGLEHLIREQELISMKEIHLTQ